MSGLWAGRDSRLIKSEIDIYPRIRTCISKIYYRECASVGGLTTCNTRELIVKFVEQVVEMRTGSKEYPSIVSATRRLDAICASRPV